MRNQDMRPYLKVPSMITCHETMINSNSTFGRLVNLAWDEIKAGGQQWVTEK
jgi:hypothetical protein